ncbi:sulfatase [Bremerella sp. JC817]|uniref:sulfatase family protein n=1 Tax=Bremerella sp. JC817 TaxID=3231756 RepID=UPI003458125B
MHRISLAVLALFALIGSARAADLPNIVVFLSDDHTLTDSSLYGSTDLKTPNMERIAKQGLTFDRAFVASPSCAPSRAALLTGLMPSRNGAEPNHSRPRAEIKKLPAYFQDLGYEVVSFGKVGHYAQTPEYGFDLAKHFKYHEDIAIGEAIKWLKARESDKPLVLFVGTNWPHVPWPEAKDIDPKSIKIPLTHVHTPQTRAARARYYQAVKTMDRELGEVFDEAYAKLGENTLFLHTSDHGAQWPFGKWTLYDDGIRTPMIAVWPGHIAADKRTGAMVSWVDILPTLYAATGQTPPESIDGKSFLPVLEGEKTDHRDAIFTVHSGDGNNNVYPTRSVRTERWKYIRNLHPEFKFSSHVVREKRPVPYWDSWVKKAETVKEAARKVKRYTQRPAEELYDLEADPMEQNNLALDPEHAETLNQLRGKLDAWMKEQGDQEKIYGEPILLENE